MKVKLTHYPAVRSPAMDRARFKLRPAGARKAPGTASGRRRCFPVTAVDARREQPMPTYENDRVVESATEARAGITGQHVRYVLGFGTAGVIALFVVIYLYFFV
jgi:hypothetical protein